jgi:hypothetical protein
MVELLVFVLYLHIIPVAAAASVGHKTSACRSGNETFILPPPENWAPCCFVLFKARSKANAHSEPVFWLLGWRVSRAFPLPFNNGLAPIHFYKNLSLIYDRSSQELVGVPVILELFPLTKRWLPQSEQDVLLSKAGISKTWGKQEGKEQGLADEIPASPCFY